MVKETALHRSNIASQPSDIAGARTRLRSIQPATYMGGGRNTHMTRMPPEVLGRMHTCMRLSCDSRLGRVAGTTPVPFLDVTTIIPPS